MILTNQQQRILDWLKKKGSIDPLESWKHCGVYRLGAVIFELKKAGHIIETNRKKVTNSFGESCHPANYIYHGHINDAPDDDLYPEGE